MLVMKVSKYWKMVEFRKISIKMKNYKGFYETQTASHLKEFIQPPPPPIPPDKILLRLCNRNALKKICRNLQTFAFKVLQECSFWASGNGTVQMFFLTPNRNMFAWKFPKWERFLAVFREDIIFNVKWVEVRKMSEIFWA